MAAESMLDIDRHVSLIGLSESQLTLLYAPDSVVHQIRYK